MKLRYPLHIHISALFAILVVLVGALIGGIGFRLSSSILETGASELSQRIARETVRDFTQIVSPAEMAVRMLSQGALGRSASEAERRAFLALMREALSSSHELASIYAGFDNGDFCLLRRLPDERERAAFSAPPHTAYLLQAIAEVSGVRQGRFAFLDEQLAALRTDDRPDYAADYDPRQREWYRRAMQHAGQIKTAPYVFFTSQQVGTTFANRAVDGRAVIGADIRLSTLNHILAQQKVTPGSRVVLAHASGRVIAFEDASRIIKRSESGGEDDLATLAELGVPVFERLHTEQALPELAQRGTQVLAVGGQHWRVHASPIRLEGTQTLYIVTAIPDAELLARAHDLLRHAWLAILAIMVVAIPLTVWMARSVSKSLRKLSHEAEAVRRFDFTAPISVESYVLEVNELATTMDGMKESIRRFLDISQAVAAENNFDRLLPHLLQETLSAADAEAGVLYLCENDRLRPAVALRADGQRLPLTEAPLGPDESASVLLRTALETRQPSSQPVGATDVAALGLAEAINGAAVSHAIAVPLLNRAQSLVGAMILLRPAETDANRLSFIHAVSGSAAVSLEAKELIHAQKRLFDALIQLIAGAIDAKSPYTGGHCARVPEIAQRLAQAACETREGAFAGFGMSEAQWESLRIAAWLHDCGKLTTPEYVVDKATKLETIYDRLHEIRMRFEVLKRDAEIACLKAVAAGTPEGEARAELAATWAQLDEEFAFVAACNEGGEFMAPEKVARLEQIAARTWLRTLDDRIGLGYEERARKARHPAPPLPVSETLLADKPEHQVACAPDERIPADNPYGIRMPAPELRYNLGERYNLAIARGTLTAEERYKINEHIIQTIVMLGQLPFPRHLREVPEIADNHHEKMDGTGYPRQLRGEDLSVLARIMAIADVFEALTAVDRPYKKGKTLSEALDIMARLRDQQHIDADLFALFIHSGVCLDYAQQFMRPEQIDAVDVGRYVGHPASA